MRIRSLCVTLLAGLVAAGCDSDCPTPTGPSQPGPGQTVASVTISGPSELQVGQTAQLTAKARFTDGSKKEVTGQTTWVTNNVNTCTITAAGVLTAVSAGQCTVTGVFQNISGTHVVVCFVPGEPGGPGGPGGPSGPPSGPTSGLRIEGPSSVEVGQQIQLRAFRTDNSQEVTDQASWSGNNPGAADVAAQGRVHGRSNGSVGVQAVFEGLGAVKNVQVTGGPSTCPNPPCVTPPPGTLTGLAIQGVTSIPVGQTSQLNAIASFSDGSTQNVTAQSAWSSGNPGVATVNGTGLVNGVAQGSSPITATYQGQTAQVTFNVGGSQPPTVNSLTVIGTSPLNVGQQSQYNAIANLSNGETPNVNGQAQWTSTNPGVATVNGTGLVIAVAPGTTTISASYQGKSDAVNLTVTGGGGNPTVTGVTVTGSSPLGIGQTAQYTAIATLSDGNSVNVTAQASWASSAANIATVNASGVVTAVAAGTTIIAASFQGHTGAANLEVGGGGGPGEPVVVGLEVAVEGNILSGGLTLDLAQLIRDPIIDLKVFALYSDGSKREVTGSAVISSTSPLLRIDGPGVLNLVDVLVQSLLNPDYVVNVVFGGFTAVVRIHISVNILGIQLPNIGNLGIGAKLPSITVLLAGGAQLIIPPDFEGLNWILAPHGLLGGLLAGIGQVIGSVLTITGGVLQGLNLGLLGPILNTLGGVLTLDLSCVLNGITSNVVPISVPVQ